MTDQPPDTTESAPDAPPGTDRDSTKPAAASRSRHWLWPAIFVPLALVWSTGIVNQLVPALPSPARVQQFFENVGKADTIEDSFRIVLCWLQYDAGANTKQVESAFYDLGGVDLVTSHRVVAASAAKDRREPILVKRALAVMNDWNADLALVGVVRHSSQSASLWFVSRHGRRIEKRFDYDLADMNAEGELRKAIQSQLTATVLGILAESGGSEARHATVVEQLTSMERRIGALIERGLPQAEKPRLHADLRAARGAARLLLGYERKSPQAI